MSSALTLVLDQRDMAVTLQGKALCIERPGAPPERVPLGLLGQVIVHGAPLVACDVWRALAERHIAAVLLPARGRGVGVFLDGGLANAVMVRVAQHRRHAAADDNLETARWVLDRKLRAYAALLPEPAAIEEKGTPPGRSPAPLAGLLPEPAAREARQLFDRQRMALSSAGSHAALMGHEGVASAAWFRLLSRALPPAWGFKGRNRQPPRDPVNALLSLTYTLVQAELGQTVRQRGLDPGIGFLHTVAPGRESLVLDLLEPLRAGADAFVLGLLGMPLSPGDFTRSEREGCRLDKTGRAAYYQAWSAYRLAWPGGLTPPEGETPEDPGDEDPLSLGRCCRRLIREMTGTWGIPPDEKGE